jgi:hypothetical protein
MKDINEGFPPDEFTYTESYDYLSDSDLEDDELEGPRGDQSRDSQVTPDNASQPSQDASGVENHSP